MKTFKFLLSVIAFLFCFNFGTAQEIKAEKHENLKWYTITYFDFHPGKMSDAKKIIEEYFKPTGKEVGHQPPVMEMELLYSDWDYVVVFPMEEGLQEFDWKTSPRDVEYRKAFYKRVGGEDKANEIWDKFGSYVKDSKSQLARTVN